MQESALKKLTSKNLLKKNIILNFIAQGLPLIVAVFTIPFIIKGLGVDRFSILTLIWIVLGYSSLFDFGLSRALTQLISKKIAKNEENEIPDLIRTTLLIVLILGILASILLCLLIPFIVFDILKIPPKFTQESLQSLYLLALTLPLMLLIVNIRGVLEAYQKFFAITMLRLPIIFFNYIGPLFVLPFTNNLVHVVLLLVVGRVITFFLNVYVCLKSVDGLSSSLNINKKFIRPLFSFGGWITVSNVVGPISSYMDRFFLANIVSAIVVAYYTTPFDVITRLSIVPLSIIGVMFPAFSTEYHKDVNKTSKMYFKTVKLTAILLFIPVVLIILLSRFGLTIWLGTEFAEKSYIITQILALGVFIEGINQCAIGLIQGTGKADITGKIILIVLPFYLIVLYFCVSTYGLTGAAIAWCFRASLDFIFLNYFAFKLLKPDKNLL